MTKLNIIYESDYLNGYINISSSKHEKEDVLIGDIANIDWAIDNGELDELIADKVLEYVPHKILQQVISNWVSKLRIGGRLVIGIVDSLELCRMVNIGVVEFNNYNTIVHGEQNNNIQFKKNSLTTKQVIDIVTGQHGYKVYDHILHGVDSTITFERIK